MPDRVGEGDTTTAETLESIVSKTRAAHDAGRVLHDPEVKGGPCPECDEPWPCAERRRQRALLKPMHAYLEADLYKRSEQLPTDPPGPRFTSPIGWSVWWTYGHAGIPMTIRAPDGHPYAWTTSADIYWLEEYLP